MYYVCECVYVCSMYVCTILCVYVHACIMYVNAYVCVCLYVFRPITLHLVSMICYFSSGGSDCCPIII